MMISTILLNLMVGVLLGVFFFGGLWLTVRKCINMQTPQLWFLASFLVRMVVAVFGFYIISQSGQWQALASALLGFIIARFFFVRLKAETISPSIKDSPHAP